MKYFLIWVKSTLFIASALEQGQTLASNYTEINLMGHPVNYSWYDVKRGYQFRYYTMTISGDAWKL